MGSSRISTDKSSPKYREMLEYDGLMASLVSLVGEYRATCRFSLARD